MDTDSIAAKERKARKEHPPLRLDRGEGRGEVSILRSQLSTFNSPAHTGGHQSGNGGMRDGTECVPLILGMGKAAELARKQLPGYEKNVCSLRDALEEGSWVQSPTAMKA